MQRDEIVEMARQAGFSEVDGIVTGGVSDVEAFSKLVAAKAIAKDREEFDIDELCARHNKIGYKQGYRAGQTDERRKAIEEAENQEPAAYVPYGVFDAWLDQAWLGVRCLNPQLCDPDKVDVQPIYAYPKPLREPLTHEVIERDFYGRVDFVRQVEAAHGINGQP